MSKERVLIVEDDAFVRGLLQICLKNEGVFLEFAGTGEEALAHLDDREWDLVFLDYILPDENGLVILKKLKDADPELPVIFMTAHGSVDVAVKAMQAGALDYLTKPLNAEMVIPRVRNALELTSMRRTLRAAREKMEERFGFDRIVGVGPPMDRVLELVKTVAESEAQTILLLGESGVGKNLIAQAIHYNSSRAAFPFMEITCTSLTESLMESELFGHEKGAFTDARTAKKGLCELADRGTVFLDEIGDMPLGMQAKLLRFIEARTFRRVGGTTEIPVDVRVIAATNTDLREAIDEKRFRTDLFFRLNVMEIDIPPLRQRPNDIPLLVMAMIREYNEKFRKDVVGIDDEALARLGAYGWPGNVRELRNMVERAMILSKNTTLRAEDFPLNGTKSGGSESSMHGLRLPPSGFVLEDHERDLLKQALDSAGGNQTRAAKQLGITRNQLIYRMKKFGLN